ncbi:MAG: SpoIIE family protein phosphatase [Phycisphaerales bacterium]|nr:SpoIIE family protein phosphatase [Phycisphaerales bacterium]
MSEAPPMIEASAGALMRAFAVLERLQATNDLAEVLNLVINAMRDGLHAERASVFQFDDKTSELFMSQGHGATEIRFPITKGIAGEAARTRSILNIPDCYADGRFNPEVDRKTGFRTRNMLTIPLLSSGGTLEGVAQVLNKDPDKGSCFDAGDETVARILSVQAAIALRRAKLLQAEARKNKIEHDLSIARKIQQAGFPKRLPQIDGYDLAAVSQPAEETGGDAYDMFQPGVDIDDLEAGKAAPLLFALGDATGHGIGPALSAGQFRAMFRMGARLDADLPLIARQVNAQLCHDLPMGRFVTAFMGTLDPLEHTIRYVAAGQAPIILLKASGEAEIRDASAMPLGLDADFTVDDVEPFRLEPGDSFLLISDGFFEALDPDHDQFGTDRVLDAVRTCGTRASAGAMLEAIAASIRVFVRGRPFDDDQTAIIIRRNPAE